MVLSVGRLIGSKRFDLLQKSFAELAQEFPDWDLCILGEGPLRESLEISGKSLGLDRRLLMPGYSQTPWEWYALADIYVLTSSYEGMPNTLLEAMAQGVAPIAFDIKAGPSDLLKGGELGILLPDDRHVERLTRALRDLMLDEGRRAAFGNGARRVVNDYAMPRIIEHWDEVFRKVISKKRPKRWESS
jgi:GalNAc-alpha-(1->4)-GalNAc-alpha-(1->3)-diNAcBac-PP-undecaprenol alpha-1,4-N-acetyl-D-galactosaminyltransferase